MTIIATYSSVHAAENAISLLSEMGITRDHISVATSKETSQSLGGADHTSPDKMVKEATGGTTTGTLVGAATGVLATLVASATGIGAFVFGGPLVPLLWGSALAANVATGSAIGALGGFVTGLVKAGVNEAEAEKMEKTIQAGGVMVAIQSDSVEGLEEIVRKTDPVDIVKINNQH